MSKHRGSPFESPSEHLFSLRRIVRYVRNILIVGIAVCLLVDCFGEPLLRWEYRYRGSYANRQVLSATYVGVLRGQIESEALRDPKGCPLVLFVQPEPPLWQLTLDRILSAIH